MERVGEGAEGVALQPKGVKRREVVDCVHHTRDVVVRCDEQLKRAQRRERIGQHKKFVKANVKRPQGKEGRKLRGQPPQEI